MRCSVAGWGRNDFAYGSNQAIERKVDVPLVDFQACQATLRMTRLGKNFILDPGFMCAGMSILNLNAIYLKKYYFGIAQGARWEKMLVSFLVYLEAV